jgi:hypothetical protein
VNSPLHYYSSVLKDSSKASLAPILSSRSVESREVCKSIGR